MGSSTSLFSKYCKQPVASCVRGNLNEYFGIPIYNKYEEEYMHIIPNELDIEPNPVDGDNQ